MKLSLRIVAPCPFFVRSHGAAWRMAPTIQPSRLHMWPSILLHANLNIILRIMGLMLSDAIRVPTIHVQAIDSNDRTRNSERAISSPDVSNYYIDQDTIWTISQLSANKMIIYNSHYVCAIYPITFTHTRLKILC